MGRPLRRRGTGDSPPGVKWTIDINLLFVADGIGMLKWGATQMSTTPSWTYDFDDLIWWVD